MSSTKITEFDLDTSADIAKESTLRENFETLDSILDETETAMEEINTKIGTPAEEGQTLFSLLGNSSSKGMTAVKSIQHIICDLQNTSNKTVSIQKVDSTKCFCLHERLNFAPNCASLKSEYVLTDDSVTFTSTGMNDVHKVGLWIIELC